MAKPSSSKEAVGSWSELDKKIKNFAYWPEYIFRGQAQDNWLLESTISRVLKKIKARNKKRISIRAY